mgnify:FL=1
MFYFISKKKTHVCFVFISTWLNNLNFQDLHPIGSTFKGISMGQVKQF